jgi:hypothetical protein
MLTDFLSFLIFVDIPGLSLSLKIFSTVVYSRYVLYFDHKQTKTNYGKIFCKYTSKMVLRAKNIFSWKQGLKSFYLPEKGAEGENGGEEVVLYPGWWEWTRTWAKILYNDLWRGPVVTIRVGRKIFSWEISQTFWWDCPFKVNVSIIERQRSRIISFSFVVRHYQKRYLFYLLYIIKEVQIYLVRVSSSGTRRAARMQRYQAAPAWSDTCSDRNWRHRGV